MFDSFNHFISLLFLLLWSAISAVVPVPATRLIATPSATLTATPAPTKTTLNVPTPKTQTIQTSQPVPWGTTEKLGEGLYRTYVANDPAMGTPAEILQALNSYRRAHNAGYVFSDDKLCSLAQSRAQEQDKLGNLDEHKGLIDYMADQSHWSYLNVTGIGENASYGYVLSGVHLIEWVFDSDEEHRENQLNPDWALACAGVSGVTVDIIFGKR